MYQFGMAMTDTPNRGDMANNTKGYHLIPLTAITTTTFTFKLCTHTHTHTHTHTQRNSRNASILYGELQRGSTTQSPPHHTTHHTPPAAATRCNSSTDPWAQALPDTCLVHTHIIYTEICTNLPSSYSQYLKLHITHSRPLIRTMPLPRVSSDCLLAIHNYF